MGFKGWTENAIIGQLRYSNLALLKIIEIFCMLRELKTSIQNDLDLKRKKRKQEKEKIDRIIMTWRYLIGQDIHHMEENKR